MTVRETDVNVSEDKDESEETEEQEDGDSDEYKLLPPLAELSTILIRRPPLALVVVGTLQLLVLVFVNKFFSLDNFVAAT